ncbi:isoprenylcysteine carboxylmethyltransferase family protein [Lacimicrobium sp. SS2-24]|uniref:methyltransferase family protein n=1 Tax=Lacimicrobium sp. SS2-24 TaxID=2005569 RepID=UPI000B4B49E8|nr:isoprenylcysteine carboxylmethyltransferase family protein [Lacimicrobium sp. SS2-24]
MDSTGTAIAFSRIFLAAFYTFVAAFYVVSITVKKRSQHTEVIFPGQRFCATWWNHILFRVFRIAIWMVCVWRFFLPQTEHYLGMFSSLYHAPVVITGMILLSVGFVGTMSIHLLLGDRWRSGIDPYQPEGLMTQGVYGLSRNPMFVGVAMAQLGFFLALPSMFSLVCLLVGQVTLHRQVKSEEAHLSARFPQDYALYRRNVRRWL